MSHPTDHEASAPSGTASPSPSPEEIADVVSDTETTEEIALLALYAALLLFVAVQIVRLFKNKHKKVSFQLGFLLSSSVWLLLRVIYFACGLEDRGFADTRTKMLLYGLPFASQFTTFSLLLLFFASLVHKRTWAEKQRRFLGALVVANVFVYAFVIGWIYSTDAARQRRLEMILSIHSTVVFALLTITLGYYCHRLVELVKDNQPSLPGTPVQCTPYTVSWRLLYRTYFIQLLFLSRTVFSFLTVVTDWNLPTLHRTAVAFYDIDRTFVLIFFLWEILPIALILSYFTIPSQSRLRSTSSHDYGRASLPPTMYLDINSDPESSAAVSFFSNPKRYDSDDESSASLLSHSGSYRTMGAGPSYMRTPPVRPQSYQSIERVPYSLADPGTLSVARQWPTAIVRPGTYSSSAQ